MWIIKGKNILGAFQSWYNEIEEAKQALHQLRLNGCDGYIYRGN
jgi:hypothetical protein